MKLETLSSALPLNSSAIMELSSVSTIISTKFSSMNLHLEKVILEDSVKIFGVLNLNLESCLT